MDKKLGVQVPITMADLVQRIMRGIRRFFLVSQNSASCLLPPNKT
jgi:hypothetical protein